jgi:hypothetical protein
MQQGAGAGQARVVQHRPKRLPDVGHVDSDFHPATEIFDRIEFLVPLVPSPWTELSAAVPPGWLTLQLNAPLSASGRWLLAVRVGARLRPVAEADDDGDEPGRHEGLAGLRRYRHDVLTSMATATFQITPRRGSSFDVVMTTVGGQAERSPVLAGSTKRKPGLCRPGGCGNRLIRVSIRCPERLPNVLPSDIGQSDSIAADRPFCCSFFISNCAIDDAEWWTPPGAHPASPAAQGVVLGVRTMTSSGCRTSVIRRDTPFSADPR